ncbi:AAA family ATPase [Sinorhizobium fredii]|uniref:AAA family ATPase n=1 Tax=Rhizobium fredii TaxID=380 RepID=UPI00056A2843|nr:AAA family ATPase [Sinorhizobium fredii]
MVEIPPKNIAPDWNGIWGEPSASTPEQDRLAYELAPLHLKPVYEERLKMDPETRRLDLEARKAEAEARRATEVSAMTDKFIEQLTIQERIEEKKIEKEKVKQRKQDSPPLADPNSIELEFALSTDTATVRINYLLDPYLPANCVVGFYGRGSTSKSSFLASMAAHISSVASTLWISVEEPADWIKVRHIGAGGADKTLQVVKAVAVKKDGHGRTVGSTFNTYEMLEPAIIAAKANLLNVPNSKSLRLVVLDTVVGLTTWTASAGPNSDEGVKRLLAYLQGLAEAHDVTIAIIGHANKGKHEHFADVVMGASAWTNSPRLSFVHAADRREEYAYVIRVAKTNLVTFGATYKTVPVHTLYERADGPDSVLCRVTPGPTVWGDADSMDLWEEATTVPKDDEDGFSDTRIPSIVEKAIQVVVETIMTTGVAQLTREEVEQKLGRNVGRREWKRVDAHLQNHPTVLFEKGAKNRVFYKRRE